MPVLAPPALLFAVTVISPPSAVTVNAPNETMVLAVVLVPVMDIDAPVIDPVLLIAVPVVLLATIVTALEAVMVLLFWIA